MADRERRYNYSKWSKDELKRAESTATQFLEQNGPQITETFRAKMRCLEILVNRLNTKKLTLDQRLDCFARISEISSMMKDEAEGFFELASQPIVARILSSVPQKR